MSGGHDGGGCNVGPRVAQVAAVARLIDYVVTVAVQTATRQLGHRLRFPPRGGTGLRTAPYLFTGSLPARQDLGRDL
jgi:hypothetical protein